LTLFNDDDASMMAPLLRALQVTVVGGFCSAD
jgi:hypothetical protein